jgi:lipopolysaccharide transport system permease protein
MTVLGFAFLSRHRILPISITPVPYALYALWGLSLWQLFAGCYRAAAQSLTEAAPMIGKLRFPKDALVFASIGRPIFDFLMRTAAVAVFLAVYRIVPAWTAVFLPAAVLPIVLMAIGLGMIVAVIATTGTDVLNVLDMLLLFGMLVTPVLYPPPATWPFCLVNVVNPISPVILACHDLLERGSLTAPDLYLMSWLFAVLLFGIAWRFFCLAIPRIAERF